MLAALAPGRVLTETEIRTALVAGLGALPVEGRRVLVIVPDATRTLPMPLLHEIISGALLERARELTTLVALGTHPPMSDAALESHLGPRAAGGRPAVVQHRWNDDDALAHCGVLPSGLVGALSRGMMDQAVPVRVSRLVLEADLTLLVGPVFPHELIGFSGGHKYLFPGVSGPEMVDATHWLGAHIGNVDVHGVRDTPPRRLIEAASDLVPGERHALCLAMRGTDVHGLYLGGVREAWTEAVAKSQVLNVVRLPHAYRTVIAGVPERYEDLWTGSKCMTKLERVVADGGKLVLHGPHIRSPALSFEGGGWHERIGYHVRDWFLAHRDRYQDVPLAVLADLMQLPGSGTWKDGRESRRIQVLLATGIPPGQCRGIGLEWADPEAWRPADHVANKDPDTLVVPESGEVLYRLEQEPT